MSEDYYGILGVKKDASEADIKKAFRQKAKEHHPDKGGDAAKFKKINEAYKVLSDKQKRAQYDRFGKAGTQFGGGGGAGQGFDFSSFDFNGMGGDFGGFEDIFSSFFGGGGMSRGQSARRPAYTRGSDLELEVQLSFEESIEGVKKSFSSHQNVVCKDCKGEGGKGAQTCEDCGGKGVKVQQFKTPFGNVAQQVTCEKCQGEGKQFKSPCKTCKGEGRVKEKVSYDIDIPAGIEDGQTLTLRGKGEAGRKGGRSGDLYVHIRVEPSNEFTRRGSDLYSVLNISVFEALLGGKQKVQTFWGEVDMTLPENTRDGETFRIRGKGVKSQHYTGDHIVKIVYTMPKKISKKLRDLLEAAQKES